MKKYILSIVLIVISILCVEAQDSPPVIYQLPAWTGIQKQMDSAFVVESEGRNHRLLVVLDSMYQRLDITFNRQTGKFNMEGGRWRSGGYLYNKFKDEDHTRGIVARRDSVISRNIRLLSLITTPIDTSDLIPPPPPDTTGN